jgi:predicted nucleic acid-binding protein
VKPDNSPYMLDSFALLAYLNDEEGRERVQETLEQARRGECLVMMCFINLGEVLYITERRRGRNWAQRTQALVEGLPLTLLEVTRDLVLDAAHIKAQHAISYADAFVAAAAQREGARVLTGDPEFEAVEMLVPVEWLHSVGQA